MADGLTDFVLLYLYIYILRQLASPPPSLVHSAGRGSFCYIHITIIVVASVGSRSRRSCSSISSIRHKCSNETKSIVGRISGDADTNRNSRRCFRSANKRLFALQRIVHIATIKLRQTILNYKLYKSKSCDCVVYMQYAMLRKSKRERESREKIWGNTRSYSIFCIDSEILEISMLLLPLLPLVSPLPPLHTTYIGEHGNNIANSILAKLLVSLLAVTVVNPITLGAGNDDEGSIEDRLAR